MVTLVHTDDLRAEPRPNVFAALGLAWQGYRQRRADRRALALAGLRGPRLVADMGLDPEAVQAAIGADWGALRPNGILVRHRW